MRLCSVVAGILACMVSSVAYAETWKTQPKMVKERSSARCQDTASPATFTVNGGTLRFVLPSGPREFPIAADGKVDAYYKALSGDRLRIQGNVNTKQFEVVNTDSGCTYVYHVIPG
jgi:hypothetical protein